MRVSRLSKAEFSHGQLSLYGHPDPLVAGQGITGHVELNIKHSVFARGLWIKLVGKNRTEQGDIDLLKGDRDHHIDGVHQVFFGFGEEDDDNGALLELPVGKSRYAYNFKLPADSPLSYCDDTTEVYYKLTCVFDGAGIPLQHSQASSIMIVGYNSDTSISKMLKSANYIRQNTIIKGDDGNSDSYSWLSKLGEQFSVQIQGKSSHPLGVRYCTGQQIFTFNCKVSRNQKLRFWNPSSLSVYVRTELFVATTVGLGPSNNDFLKLLGSTIPASSDMKPYGTATESMVMEIPASKSDRRRHETRRYSVNHQKHLVWRGITELLHNGVDSDNIDISVPLNIDAAARESALRVRILSLV